MTKIKINSRPPEGKPYYTHLQPIVDALVAHGNRVISMPTWTTNQGGQYTQLELPIDFELVRRTFELPDSIYLEESDDSIFCSKTWIYIHGGNFESILRRRREVV